MKPILLDTFCKAGGATRGYQMAGFRVVGVDIEHQPNYCGDEFHQADALEFIERYGRQFDAIHASPPCQGYSATRTIPNRDSDRHPQLIAATRSLLNRTGRPWVIENVQRSPLLSGVMLCGLMFGLRVYRHRLFESSVLLFQPPHPRHVERINNTDKRLGYYTGEVGAMVTVAGHLFSRAAGSAAMGIDWMTREELAQAIPPAYTEWVGTQLLAYLGASPAPAWVPCDEGCGDFWCRVHDLHAFECECPPIEDWEADPYTAIPELAHAV